MKYVIDLKGSEEVSLICAIERTIKQKQEAIDSMIIDNSMIEFQKDEISRLKNVILKIKNKKMLI